MKRNLVKIISVVMTVIMVAVFAPFTNVENIFSIKAEAATVSGSLGGSVSWSYNSSNKTITVSGSGNMKEFANDDDGQKWKTYRANLVGTVAGLATKIVINSGVTNIGKNAFRNLTKVTTVTIPDTVKTINQSAFEGCSSLSSASFTDNLTSIGAYAFKGTKLTSITMPNSVTSIGDYAFANVSGLKITCNYGDAAYTYCVGNGVSYALKAPSLACSATLDANKKQVNVLVKLKNATGFNAGNFVLTYDSAAITPVSTDMVYTNGDSITSAVVYNEAGKISIAALANSQVEFSACESDCTFTVVSIPFKVAGQNDKADFSLSSTVGMRLESKVSIASATASVDLHSYTSAVTKAPTCCEEGVKTNTCALCGKQYTESIAKDAANHVGGTEVKNAKAPTCGAVGYSGDTVCKGCGAVISNGTEIAATGNHTFGDWSVTTASTCSSKGIETRTCTVCGKAETRETDFSDTHTFGEWTVTKAATCVDKGTETRTCTGCGQTETRETAPTGAHTYGEWTVTKAANCTNKGTETRTCTLCGAKETREIAPTGVHSYGEWTVTKAANCTNKGTETRTCTVCRATETREIAANGVHEFGEWKVVKQATCIDKGTETRTCAVCGATETRETATVNHDYTAVVTKPTCTENGYTTYSCANCGDIYKGNIVPATGHDYDANGVCKNCGDVKVTSIAFKDSAVASVDNTAKVIKVSKPISQADFSANISSGTWTVTAADGTATSGTDPVKSGCIVKQTSGNTSYVLVLIGDLNLDGKVSAADARLALRISAGLDTATDVQLLAGDLDSNKKLSASEARKILRVSANLESF